MSKAGETENFPSVLIGNKQRGVTCFRVFGPRATNLKTSWNFFSEAKTCRSHNINPQAQRHISSSGLLCIKKLKINKIIDPSIKNCMLAAQQIRRGCRRGGGHFSWRPRAGICPWGCRQPGRDAPDGRSDTCLTPACKLTDSVRRKDVR